MGSELGSISERGMCIGEVLLGVWMTATCPSWMGRLTRLEKFGVFDLSPNASLVAVDEWSQSVQQVLTDEQWFCIDGTDVDGMCQAHLLEGDIDPGTFCDG